MPVAVEVDPIQYEVDGHVARIWLNRPHKRNSVSQQLLEELDQARIRAEEDPDVRVMVIRGREGTFCSGFDLDELQGDFVGTTRAYEIAQRSARICDAFFRSPEAVRERPRGLHDRRRVRDPHQLRLLDRRGDRQDRRLPHPSRTVRRRRSDLSTTADPRRAAAKELMLTGKLLTGRQAYEWGLVQEVAPAEELDQCVDDFVAQLTDKSPFQMAITKMTVNRGLDADAETMMVLERLAVGVTLNSKDAAEGVAAFLEKRDPVWTGS